MFFSTGSVLFIWAFIGLTNGSLGRSFFPCTYSAKTDAYDKFLSKHVRSGTPTSLDQNQWQAFIRQIGTCDRRVQSFIPFDQKQQVNNVCSASGGKTYIDNLCVSKQQFTFTTVFVDNNCIVYGVIRERKYLLLACDLIQGYCHPVHFEPNPNNDGPDNRHPDCEKPNSQNQDVMLSEGFI